MLSIGANKYIMFSHPPTQKLHPSHRFVTIIFPIYKLLDQTNRINLTGSKLKQIQNLIHSIEIFILKRYSINFKLILYVLLLN